MVCFDLQKTLISCAYASGSLAGYPNLRAPCHQPTPTAYRGQEGHGLGMGALAPDAWVQVPVWPLLNAMTLGTFLYLAVPQFLIHKMGMMRLIVF